MEQQPLVLINAVGLTALLADAPRLQQLARCGLGPLARGGRAGRHLHGPGQLLTGRPPQEHGIVGNGWLFRETGEVRFWQQSNALIQAEPIYATARRLAGERGRSFRSAKLFWWFNQGADVDISVTPKPYYGADGNKVFGIPGTPDGLCERLEASAGPVPLPHVLGPGRRAAVHRLDRAGRRRRADDRSGPT